MTPFLKQVADHYSDQGDMARMCFVFPNRRSIAFFKKYLAEQAARTRRPMLAPYMYAENEFVYLLASARQTDRIYQLTELYDVYRKLNPKAESLDDFIFWGGMLISDFDDVDKYLVDPHKLFTNVSDFKQLSDSFQYLNERQLDAVRRFAGHFRTGGQYKEEFRHIWDILLPLYEGFNAALDAKGLTYEGQAYRRLAERLDTVSVADLTAECLPDVDKFVFVGLNALNECERKLLSRLRDARLAEFCWDFSSSMIKDPDNRSSLFMSSNVIRFPQAFELDPDGLELPEINVLSVPSSTGQAKELPSILSRLRSTGMDTAVVLPDETMLLPVLNSIPDTLSDINVTMGYPLGGSELWSLMNDISALQMHMRLRDGTWYFYHRQVWGIFSNSVFKSILDEAGRARIESLRKSAGYYISEQELSGHPVFDLIFRPVVKNADAADQETIRAIEDYQRSIVGGIGPMLKAVPGMAIELDFAKAYFQAIGRLSSCRLEVRPSTYFRLLGQLVGSSSVPFLGEPLKGLQIMGPLETRALDFDNLIVLNCNEGFFPRKSVASSFIPAELRKGFDLPTYEYQDAVWAYYFYRMIQRAKHVWLLFDSRAEVNRGGEESRYIKQLELHFGVSLTRYVAKYPMKSCTVDAELPKTEDDIRRLKTECRLSVSALQNYQECPARFYYHTVCRLYPENEVSESLDASMIGTVFHATMENLYKRPDRKVTKQWLKSLDRQTVRKEVERNIMDTLHTFEISGRNIIFEDMVIRYVLNTVRRDMELLESCGRDCFHVYETEYEKYGTIGGFRFKGIIDRLDSIDPGELRIVDYKTGGLDKTKVGLQLYIYGLLMQGDAYAEDRQIVNSVYHMTGLFVDPVTVVRMEEDERKENEAVLKSILSELEDPAVGFKRVGNTEKCKYCDYREICGR